jgi:hypothetical protein
MKPRLVCLFLLIGYLSAVGMGAGASGSAPAPDDRAQPGAGNRTVVQMSYYALPGMEAAVLRNRADASAVLARNGITSGRILTRIESSRATRDVDGPDVVWEGEFPDREALQRYEQTADNNPEFREARTKMGMLTRKTERRYFAIR